MVKATKLSSPKLSVLELNGDGMPVTRPPLHVPSVTVGYTNCSVWYSHAKWQRVRRLTLARRLKRFRSSNLSPMVDSAVSKGQQTIYEMMDAARPVAKEVEVKE